MEGARVSKAWSQIWQVEFENPSKSLYVPDKTVQNFTVFLEGWRGPSAEARKQSLSKGEGHEVGGMLRLSETQREERF